MHDRGRCDTLSISYVGDVQFDAEECDICYTAHYGFRPGANWGFAGREDQWLGRLP